MISFLGPKVWELWLFAWFKLAMTDDAIRSSYCEVRGGVNGSENESWSITCANEKDTSGTSSRPCSVSETTWRSDLELGGRAARSTVSVWISSYMTIEYYVTWPCLKCVITVVFWNMRIWIIATVTSSLLRTCKPYVEFVGLEDLTLHAFGDSGIYEWPFCITVSSTMRKA